MRIGILGGSFDPVHNAHLILAQTAREALALDVVRLMVAGQQPHKTAPHHAPAADRFAMVSRAVAGVPGLVADDRELHRPPPSYTVETLRALRAESPEDELVLLLGSDSAAGFDRWHAPDQIRRLARIAVCRRPGTPVPSGFDVTWEAPALDLSSTVIRQRAATGRSLAGWVPQAVADYISGLRLYGGRQG